MGKGIRQGETGVGEIQQIGFGNRGGISWVETAMPWRTEFATALWNVWVWSLAVIEPERQSGAGKSL